MNTDVAKKDAMMTATGMMKDDMKMMSGEKTEWTKEEMETMEKENMMMSGADSMKMDDKMIMATGAMMQKETLKIETSMASHGYMDYSPELVASALQSGQKVVLFFHAAWCPTCKALNSAITSDLASIPANTLIVKVDYDTSDALKRKYGVTTQHTTVTLNSDGTMKSKKIGARSVNEVLN